MFKNEWILAGTYALIGLTTIGVGAFIGGILVLEYLRITL